MSKRAPRMPGQTARSRTVVAPPPAPPSLEARPTATSPVGDVDVDDPWASLAGILERAAREAGRTVDVGAIIDRFKRAVRAYEWEKALPNRPAVKERRRRLRRLEVALDRLDGV